jgi:hypothetical protein
VLLYLAHLRRIPLDFFPLYVCDSYFIRHGEHHYIRSGGINTVQL